MSDKPEPSPRPWRVEPNARRIFVDANGRYVGSCFVGAASALVVDAVNDRDRLSDLVRRLADNISRYHLVGERERAMLREARAAIGEDAP